MRRPHRSAAGALVALTLLAGAVPAMAGQRAGRLDHGFGKEGWAMTRLGIATVGTGVEVGSGPAGSAIVAGALGGPIVRFLPNGSPDPSFGTGGRLQLGPASLREGIGQLTFFSQAMAVDGRGRVLVFGTQTDTRQTFIAPGEAQGQPKSSAVVLRFTPGGRPDPTFGEGAGFVRGAFGLGSGLDTEVPMVGVRAGTVDSRNRPVFVAGVAAAVSGCYAHGTVSYVPHAVVRLTESGQADAGFGAGDGVSLIEGSAGFPGLGLDAADQPVVGAGSLGGHDAGCEPGTTVYRLRQDGGRLTGFGTDGVRVFERLHLALVEPSGALILTRRQGPTLHLVRVGANGVRDRGFGEGGVERLRLPFAVGFHLKPTAVDGKGRILLAGFVGSPTAEPITGQPKHSSLVVARLRADGRPDPGFGDHGWVFTRVPRALEATSAEGRLDSRGRLLVATTVARPHHRNGVLAVARYLLGP